jgi:hypothetical protein
MITHEFEIDVVGTEVNAYFSRIGGPRNKVGKSIEIEIDPLTLQTARLLENWLNLWGRIRQSEQPWVEDALSPNTFKVVGAHLWNLILNNDIGTKLRDMINSRTTQPLRVSINLVNAHSSLSGLPWEFVSMRDRNNEQVFLAAATDMVLTRYVALQGGRTKIKPADEKLGVLFVTSLPVDDYPRVALHVRDFRNEVDKIPGVEAREVLEGFNKEKIKEAVTSESPPCHVVHVVGLCREKSDELEVLLSEGRKLQKGDWQGPKPLIDALTPVDGRGPRLVVLHLCESDNGDSDENFERLAPELIRAGIPAVLALQYPMPALGETGPGLDFYNDLASSLSVGEAVQNSRHRLYDGRQLNREFGTPVLYLQDDGALIPHRPQGESPVTPSGTAGGKPGPLTDMDLLTKLLEVVDQGADEGRFDSEAAGKARDWLLDANLPDLAVATTTVFSRYKEFQYDVQLRQVYLVLLKACRSLDPAVRLG